MRAGSSVRVLAQRTGWHGWLLDDARAGGRRSVLEAEGGRIVAVAPETQRGSGDMVWKSGLGAMTVSSIWRDLGLQIPDAGR